jgi:hypothetical protein
MKCVEIILSRGRVRENDGMNLTKVHCTHIWKYGKETPLYN